MHILETLKAATTLTTLELSFNHIDAQGAKTLGTLLLNMKYLCVELYVLRWPGPYILKVF